MDEERPGFERDTLKRRIDEIAEASKKSSYSDQRSVGRTRDYGKDMVDEYPRSK